MEVKEVKSVKAPYTFMFERMRDTAVALDETICRVGDRLIDKYNLVPEDLIDFGSTHPEPGVGIGRVQCDSEGRLNSNSVILHGSLDSSSGASIPVDLSQVANFSLFPGQVVALDCNNPTGTRLVASKVYDGVVRSTAECQLQDNVTISVMVASGPFTTSDSTSLGNFILVLHIHLIFVFQEPLEDVLKVVEEVKPNAAILIGPFVDLKNTAVTSSGDSFSKQWIDMVKLIAEKATDLSSEIILGEFQYIQIGITNVFTFILVSSARDAVGYPVYPQPPIPKSDFYPKNMRSVSDPVILDIGGVHVAVTSTDILFHLGKEEISFPARNGDRMSRLASHILQQGSMYPLYPPSEEVNLDLERLDQFALIDQTPHVMLLPSDLTTFVRNIGDTTVLNPGRVTKGPGPGTFGVFRMRRGEGGRLETQAEITRI